MKPPAHAAISLTIGGILWAITKSPYAMVAGFLTGVFIDLDHLVEYYRWFVKGDNSRVWFFLHRYELVVPAFLAGYLSGWDPAVLAVSLAFLAHLLSDQLANPVGPLTYFFTYRAMKGFRRSEIIKADWEDIRQAFLSRPFARTVLGFLNPKIRLGAGGLGRRDKE